MEEKFNKEVEILENPLEILEINLNEQQQQNQQQ